MRIQPFTLGPYGTGTYIVYEYSGKECVMIDAPFPIDRALDFIRNNSLDLKAVLLTHAHFDHIFGLAEIRKEYPELPVYLENHDMKYIQDGYSATISLLESFDRLFLSRYASGTIAGMPDDLTSYGETAGPLSVIRTPGHTEGSVSLYSESEGVLFSGDTLFQGSAGRTDLGGDSAKLLTSLKKLAALPDDTLVLPGHGGTTYIGNEKKYNPYMR